MAAISKGLFFCAQSISQTMLIEAQFRILLSPYALARGAPSNNGLIWGTRG